MRAQTRRFLAAVIALAVLLPCAASAQAQAASATITGTEAPCDPSKALISPGVSTPRPDGTNHIEGMILRLCDDTNDPRTKGENIVVLNANFDSDGKGPMWGTWYLVAKAPAASSKPAPKSGGSWTGTWTGFSLSSGAEKAVILATGNGAEGYQGLRYAFTIENGAIQGRISEAPAGK